VLSGFAINLLRTDYYSCTSQSWSFFSEKLFILFVFFPIVIAFGMIPRPFSRLLWYAYLSLSVVWLLVHLVVILRFRMLDSDSILYGLPLAFSHSPFDLKIPWIGDFKTYDDVWGHHWPGAMWLRASIYTFIPFSRVCDLSCLLLAVWGSATLTARIIWRATGWWWMAGLGALLVMSDRHMLTGIQLHRFEALALLAFTVFFSFTMESRAGLIGW
jgi:hypothetical protein